MKYIHLWGGPRDGEIIQVSSGLATYIGFWNHRKFLYEKEERWRPDEEHEKFICRGEL